MPYPPHRALAEIDEDALAANYRLLAAHAARAECPAPAPAVSAPTAKTPHTPRKTHPVCLFAVVKANAYGHGAALVVPALVRAGCTAFAVACPDELPAVRAAAPRARLLVLGCTPPARAGELYALGAEQTVFSLDYARALSAAVLSLRESGSPLKFLAPRESLSPAENEISPRTGRKNGSFRGGGDPEEGLPRGWELPVHFKLDCGMCRLGFSPERPEELLAAARLPGLRPVGLSTHFPAADTDKDGTREALTRFCVCRAALARAGLRLFAHTAASAALLTLPETVLDGVRPGIALYGVPPVGTALPLRPVLTFSAPLLQVRAVEAGTPVGYGGSYRPPHATRIGVLPVGYADGLPRAAAGFSVALLHGKTRTRVRIAGRVCMDQAMVDLGGAPAAPGDRIELFSDPVPLSAHLGAIPYEVLTGLSARVERRLVRGGGHRHENPEGRMS